MGSDAPETVAAIVAAHRAATMTPAQTVARSYQRIRAYNDPAVFISLRDELAVLGVAVEDTRDGRWALGVQWHPEIGWEGDKLSTNIFRAFLRAADSSRVR